MNPKDKVKKLPSSPGVYLMKDSSGGILYVGKSKNLKNRVQSYFQNSKSHSEKVKKLVKHLKDFDYIETDTEFEAFMLECQLIQDIRPLYNRALKSPQTYMYVMFCMDRRLPTIELAPVANDEDGNLYFGPFKGRHTLDKALKGLKEIFKIDCSNPSGNSPCLNYSLGLCMGTCFDANVVEHFNDIMKKLVGLFNGTDTSVLAEIEHVMEKVAMDFEYEKAAKIRDSLEVIQSILRKEKVIEFVKENHNIVVVETIDESRVKVFLIHRDEVLYSEVCEVNALLNERIKSLIMKHFTLNTLSSSKDISKNEIDQAQIIYSYLQGKTCDYLTVKDSWLTALEQDEIDRAIEAMLSGKSGIVLS